MSKQHWRMLQVKRFFRQCRMLLRHCCRFLLATMLPVCTTMSNEISSFRQSRNKLNVFNLFRLRRKDKISFDIVAESGNIVAKNGNNVAATFDFVERTKFYDKRSTLLPFVATKSNVASTKLNVASTMFPVASTLLLVWTGRALFVK